MLDVDALNAAAGHLDRAAGHLRGLDDPRLDRAADALLAAAQHLRAAVAFDAEPDAWLDRVEVKGHC